MVIILPIILVIFSISFTYEDKIRTEYRTSYEEQPCVYITKTGDCYHSAGCRYLSRSRIPRGLYQVKASGYRCCSICNGITYGTIQVEIRESYEVTDYSFAIILSTLKVVFITPLIYKPIFKLLDKTNYYQDESNGKC
ncbi:MAG: hypothetical protein E7609_02385 [Ruminococcaceae bacterium]|nr:hypothetical protein [Oscillospiraceae bacterium]